MHTGLHGAWNPLQSVVWRAEEDHRIHEHQKVSSEVPPFSTEDLRSCLVLISSVEAFWIKLSTSKQKKPRNFPTLLNCAINFFQQRKDNWRKPNQWTPHISSQAANPHAQGPLHISTSTQVSPAQFESGLWLHRYVLKPPGVHNQPVSMFQLGLHSNSPDRGPRNKISMQSTCRWSKKKEDEASSQAKSQHVRTIM